MNRRNWLGIALILAALAITAGVIHVSAARWTHIDAGHLVAQALSHESDGNYIAHITTVAGYSGKTVETRATVFHQGSTEKIEYPDASGKTPWSMTRDGRSYVYLPKGNRLLVSEMSRVLSNKDRASLLLANYDAKCVGIDSIAGRSAYVVQLTSRYEARPSKRLWIDRENHTILRTDDYSASGSKRASTCMEQVRFHTVINPNTFVLPPIDRVEYVTVCESGVSADLFRDLGFPVTSPGYVPKGYKLEGYHLLHSTCGCTHVSAQLTYTDGLNVISVFQTRKMISCANCDMAGKCDDQNCGITTMGQVTRGNRTIVAIGDLLPEDLKKIAQSVR